MFFTELARQAEASGWHKEWRPFRSFFFHMGVNGMIYPGQIAYRRWDGSGYDPEWIYRRKKK